MSRRDLRKARFVLASASPRRSMLLGQLGFTPIVDPSSSEEIAPAGLTPPKLVEHLAAEKADEVAARHPDADLVLGADTIVVLEGEVLGKPKDREDAQRTLGKLAGRWHVVYTGYALISPQDGRRVVGHAESEVFIRPLSPGEIDAYIDTGEPMDKAGSYAIQGVGSLLVSQIRGEYTNIVGLSIPAVDAAWRELGWGLL